MKRPPPRSTLFPYTTLFRSEHGLLDRLKGEIIAVSNADLGWTLAAFETADRKSTRLNSSHVRISYAVFCLKKKKKQSTGCRRYARSCKSCSNISRAGGYTNF